MWIDGLLDCKSLLKFVNSGIEVLWKNKEIFVSGFLKVLCNFLNFVLVVFLFKKYDFNLVYFLIVCWM